MPTPGEAPTRARWILAVWLFAWCAVSAYALGSALALVGTSLPGRLVQPMGYVAPYQIARDSAPTLVPLDFIERVNGLPLVHQQDLMARASQAGTRQALMVDARRGDKPFTARVRTRRFDALRFANSFGILFGLGVLFTFLGMGVYWLKPGLASARVFAITMGVDATSLLLYFDFNTTGSLARLFLLIYPLSAAACLQLALHFPGPLSRPRLGRALSRGVWALGALVVVVLQATFVDTGPLVTDPARYHRGFLVMVWLNAWMALGLVGLVAGLAARFWAAGRGTLVRHQAGAALTGGALAFLPFVGWALIFSSSGGHDMALALAIDSMTLFPIAIAYAIVRARLFDVPLVARNGLVYFTVSALLAGVYVAVATLARLLATPFGPVSGGDTEGLVATAVVLLLFAPVRGAIQRLIDRWLFRAAYDDQHALEEASQSMISLLDVEAIVSRILEAVEATLAPVGGAVLMRSEAHEAYMPVVRSGELAFGALGFDSQLVRELEGTPEILSRVDLPVKKTHRVSGHLAPLTAELVVPLCFENRMLGLLVLGEKRSGRHFTDQDLRLLKTLANQSAIALENALAYRRIQEFNQELEARIQERTRELQEAQAMLVHNEKMAALGLLVAGVAHELNNPLSFVYTGAKLLERNTQDLLALLAAHQAGEGPDRLAALARELHADELAGEIEQILTASLYGADRMKAIVGSLRTFSRLDDFEVVPVDLAAGVEITLALVAPGYKDRVRFHLELGSVAPVQGSAGHLHQVVLNLLVNACQAIEGEGDVWIATRLEGGHVVLEVRDNGRGMDPGTRDHAFEPFFTTKPVGQGTGLGLSICHGIVAKHEGRFELDSEPGLGSTFRVYLPAAGAREVLHAHDPRR